MNQWSLCSHLYLPGCRIAPDSGFTPIYLTGNIVRKTHRINSNFDTVKLWLGITAPIQLNIDGNGKSTQKSDHVLSVELLTIEVPSRAKEFPEEGSVDGVVKETPGCGRIFGENSLNRDYLQDLEPESKRVMVPRSHQQSSSLWRRPLGKRVVGLPLVGKRGPTFRDFHLPVCRPHCWLQGITYGSLAQSCFHWDAFITDMAERIMQFTRDNLNCITLYSAAFVKVVRGVFFQMCGYRTCIGRIILVHFGEEFSRIVDGSSDGECVTNFWWMTTG